MTAREKLEQRVRQEWEASDVPIDTSTGRRFEFLTIVTAITGIVQALSAVCKIFNPDPGPTPPDPAVEADTRRFRVVSERELRNAYKDDYGRRGWRDEWRATGERALAVTREVARKSTREEMRQLAEEDGRSAAASNEITDEQLDELEADMAVELHEI